MESSSADAVVPVPSITTVPTEQPQEPDNPLLVRYRGHRTRSWGDAEALEALRLKGEGRDTSEALDLAGIPRSAIWNSDRSPVGETLRQAMVDVHTREGADWWIRQLRRVVTMELDARVVPAIVQGARDHDRLQSAQGNVPGAGALAIQINIVTTPPKESS